MEPGPALTDNTSRSVAALQSFVPAVPRRSDSVTKRPAPKDSNKHHTHGEKDAGGDDSDEDAAQKRPALVKILTDMRQDDVWRQLYEESYGVIDSQEIDEDFSWREAYESKAVERGKVLTKRQREQLYAIHESTSTHNHGEGDDEEDTQITGNNILDPNMENFLRTSTQNTATSSKQRDDGYAVSKDAPLGGPGAWVVSVLGPRGSGWAQMLGFGGPLADACVAPRK